MLGLSPPRRRPLREWLRCALLGIAIGAVVLGVGSRIAMRGIAVLAGAPGSFSVGGSLTVVLLGALSGLAGALILMVLRVLLPSRWLLQALIFYVALVLITLRGLRPVDTQRLFLFLPVVLIYGFLLRVTTRRQTVMPTVWGAVLLVAAVLALPPAVGAQRVTRNIPYRPQPSSEQFMDVYQTQPPPLGAHAAPVVLFIHGGSLQEHGERRSSPMYAPVCPGLAARGILCVTMDYRLSPTHQWPAMPDDVAAAVRWIHDSIAARGGDPKRIFLVGHSSGCLLAAAVGLDSGYLAREQLPLTVVAGVVAMGCTMAPWDTAGRNITATQLERSFLRDEGERRVYGSLAWRLRANPSAWVGPRSPPVLVVVAESERFFPSILEEGARFVRLMRERERLADIRILAGRRHVTTTTGFAEPHDAVANLVAEFVRDPKAATATP